jgi:hypothetical protein
MADPITVSLLVAADIATSWYVQTKKNPKDSHPPPPPPQDQPRTDLNWDGLEEALASSIESQIAQLVEAHPREAFYGFALDCNAAYADVLFCLNTPESLEATVREYAERHKAEDIERERGALKWGLGDWRYHAFNLESVSWNTEVPVLGDICELSNPEDAEKFLLTCCRALIRAEKAGAFQGLRKTPDFRVACIDHDEDLASGDKRLESVRES